MLRSTREWTFGVSVLLAAGAAMGQAPAVDGKKVPVQADVVVASRRAGPVDPSLVSMQATLSQRVKYQGLRRVSSTRLELSTTPTSVALPNQKTAELTLVALTDNVAQVKVKVPPVDATYSLGKDRSLYLQAGPLDGDELWLVLSMPR